MSRNEVILGVDPGFGITGYAIIKKEQQKALLLDCGYLKLPASKSLSERIVLFHDFFEEKIRSLVITSLSIETPFLGKNVQSFLKLGYLRGILHFLASRHHLILHEFSPREVKLAVTGFGGASKEQVANMVCRLFPKIKELGTIEKSDVTDALAICLSGFWRQETQPTKIALK
jgi:crossover junction endodeoxyribonuclease RuvC